LPEPPAARHLRHLSYLRHLCFWTVRDHLRHLCFWTVRGGRCRAFTEAVRVRATAEDDVYPDLSVTCDRRDLEDMRRQAIAHPCLVVEVLSPSTSLYDQHGHGHGNGKFDLYRRIPELREYMLVESTAVQVEVRRRQEGTVWTSTLYGPGEQVLITTLELSLPMAAIYEDSEMEGPPA
jgi:Uma2 family endonuclease